MRKYSSREKFLFRLILAVVFFAMVQEAWIRHDQHVANLQDEIESEREHQGLLLEKLDVDQDRLEREIKSFNRILETSQEKVLRMPNESEAIFKVQEMLSKLGEQAEINMNSQNKRKSHTISEDTGLLEIRTYFGYDCQLEDLLNFFDLLKDTPYYTAIDTLNINSYSRRRSRSRKTGAAATRRDKIRGSVVISTLFLAGTTDKNLEFDPREGLAESDDEVAGEKDPVESVRSVTEVDEGDEESRSSEEAMEASLQGDEDAQEPPAAEVVRDAVATQSPKAGEPSQASQTQRPLAGPLAPSPKPLTHTAKPKKK